MKSFIVSIAVALICVQQLEPEPPAKPDLYPDVQMVAETGEQHVPASTSRSGIRVAEGRLKVFDPIRPKSTEFVAMCVLVAIESRSTQATTRLPDTEVSNQNLGSAGIDLNGRNHKKITRALIT